MGNDRLRLADRVEEDWRALGESERTAVKEALAVLDEDPIAGAPLFEPLRGLWSYRTGTLRILYRVMPEARFVLILSITRAEERPRR